MTNFYYLVKHFNFEKKQVRKFLLSHCDFKRLFIALLVLHKDKYGIS